MISVNYKCKFYWKSSTTYNIM